MTTFRAIHLGYVAAGAVLTAAVLTVAPIVRANVAPPPTAPTSFVPITPCRLADTRTAPNGVGTRSTPLGESEVVPFTVRGQNGQCNIPADATAIVANVTAVGPSAASFVTLYPADAPQRPLASNLNLVPGGDPTPNLVSVKLSATGVVNAFNRFGTVDLIIDVVGYNTPAAGGGGPNAPIPTGTTIRGEQSFTGINSGGTDGEEYIVPLGGIAPVPLLTEDVNFGGALPTGDQDPNCTGFENSSPPGKVCMYIYNVGGLDQATLEGQQAGLTTQGFQVRYVGNGDAGSESILDIRWVYTAP